MDANRVAGVSFAVWGLIHVVVAVIALWIFFSGGTDPLLAFVDLDAAATDQAGRMADLVAEFYHALLLIGLAVTVIGLTLNLDGSRLGLGLNTVLVANIEAAFIWFEVLPGHRPVVVAVVTVGLLALGVGFGWHGLADGDSAAG